MSFNSGPRLRPYEDGMRSRIVAVLVVLTAILAPPHAVDLKGQSRKANAVAANSDRPLVLAKQGSFFVNAQSIDTAFPTAGPKPLPGHISARGMYVQYQIPAARKPGAYPVIMVHGSWHTGKTYE